jgi:hypothetical protein
VELGVCGLRNIVRRVGASASAIHRELHTTSDDVTLVTITR